MKKILLILVVLVVGSLVFLTMSPYKIKSVCFGDVCPTNGGTYVLYKVNYTKEQCLEKKGYPVEGYGWGPVYAGCSPINHK